MVLAQFHPFWAPTHFPIPIRRHRNFFLCSSLIKLPLCFQYGHLLTFLLSPVLQDLVPGGKTRNILIWTKVWGSSYFNLIKLYTRLDFPGKPFPRVEGGGTSARNAQVHVKPGKNRSELEQRLQHNSMSLIPFLPNVYVCCLDLV